MTQSTAPLAGVKVVELGLWVAGPAAGGIMADWGASVIKVETSAGDPQRNVYGSVGIDRDIPTPPFEIDNRGKKSVVLNLRDESDMSTLMTLLGEADVLITNMRVAALRRLGLDPTTLTNTFPSLVYGIITGYGLEGPDADRPGYDVGAFWARSGLAHTMVPPGELPPAIRSGQGDHTTAVTLVSGIMAALFDRSRTGKGRVVSTSLLRTGIYTLAWETSTYLRFGKRESTRHRTRSTSPLVNSYMCGDGRALWLLGLEADRHWPGIVEALGLSHLKDDERFVDAKARYKNNEVVIAELDKVFASNTYEHWITRLDEYDVWWAPVNSIPDAVADPQVLASGSFVDMTPHDGEEPYRAVNSPIDFNGYTIAPGPVPRLGEHSPEW
jgi:crotonobetainyl-CoA:carnitine CoA-transferase CaiB-like acyl-CoA transferase